MKRFIVSSLLASACLLSAASHAAPAGTQPASANPATAAHIDKHGDWLVRCFPVKSRSPCDAFFMAMVRKTGQRIYSVSIAYLPSQNRYMMQIAVPFGISLPTGLVLRTNTYTSGKLQFRRCDAGGCYVEIIMASELIDALDHADNSEAVLDVATPAGKVVPLKVSLKGFGDAHDAMVESAKAKAQ